MSTLSGGPRNLRNIVKDRIEWNIRRQGLDPEQHKWTEVFAKPSGAELDGFFSKLISMTVNGPRNAIELMKRCINNAVENKEDKLSQQQIERVAHNMEARSSSTSPVFINTFILASTISLKSSFENSSLNLRERNSRSTLRSIFFTRRT